MRVSSFLFPFLRPSVTQRQCLEATVQSPPPLGPQPWRVQVTGVKGWRNRSQEKELGTSLSAHRRLCKVRVGEGRWGWGQVQTRRGAGGSKGSQSSSGSRGDN